MNATAGAISQYAKRLRTLRGRRGRPAREGSYPRGAGLWGRLEGRLCHYPADWASSPSASFAAASSWDFTVASL